MNLFLQVLSRGLRHSKPCSLVLGLESWSCVESDIDIVCAVLCSPNSHVLSCVAKILMYGTGKILLRGTVYILFFCFLVELESDLLRAALCSQNSDAR